MKTLFRSKRSQKRTKPSVEPVRRKSDSKITFSDDVSLIESTPRSAASLPMSSVESVRESLKAAGKSTLSSGIEGLIAGISQLETAAAVGLLQLLDTPSAHQKLVETVAETPSVLNLLVRDLAQLDPEPQYYALRLLTEAVDSSNASPLVRKGLLDTLYSLLDTARAPTKCAAIELLGCLAHLAKQEFVSFFEGRRAADVLMATLQDPTLARAGLWAVRESLTDPCIFTNRELSHILLEGLKRRDPEVAVEALNLMQRLCDGSPALKKQCLRDGLAAQFVSLLQYPPQEPRIFQRALEVCQLAVLDPVFKLYLVQVNKRIPQVFVPLIDAYNEENHRAVKKALDIMECASQESTTEEPLRRSILENDYVPTLVALADKARAEVQTGIFSLVLELVTAYPLAGLNQFSYVFVRLEDRFVECGFLFRCRDVLEEPDERIGHKRDTQLYALRFLKHVSRRLKRDSKRNEMRLAFKSCSGILQIVEKYKTSGDPVVVSEAVPLHSTLDAIFGRSSFGSLF